MLEHKIEIDREGRKTCINCQQSWKGKPRSSCPGVRIVDKKSPDFDKLNRDYLRGDCVYFTSRNLRPLKPICCFKNAKDNYTYYYDSEGETELIDTKLPPVLEFTSDYFRYIDHREAVSCLKNVTGLKKLNLQPGDVESIAVYYDYNKGFISLYNPLDCAVAYKNFPRNRICGDRYHDFDPDKTDLLDKDKLRQFNLKPRKNITPYLAKWNNCVSYSQQNADWEFFWDIKQCEIDDLSLPPVYQKIPKGWWKESELHELNKKIGSDSKPRGCIWKLERFVYLYDPEDCVIIDSILPPVLSYSYFYSQKYDSRSTPCCLKDEIGLKKLNLKPGDAEPVAVYCKASAISFDRDNFTPLYNPLDCAVHIPDLPPIIENIHDIPPDLLTEKEQKELNLKPRAGMKALYVVWYQDWRHYWDIKQCEIDDLSLPVVVQEKPDYLYEKEELRFLNRKIIEDTKATACIWRYKEFIHLYDPEDCELINKNLPPCHEKKRIPKGLKSEWGWKQAEPLFELKEEAVATGCFITQAKDFKTYKTVIKTVLLYERNQLKIHDKEVFLSKTKLKQNYHLSPKFFELLGKPDKLEENPINEHYAPVQLYSRKRIEKFLSDNAEAYIKHLSKYQKYLAIFEKNKDKLLSPESRKKAQATKKVKKKIPNVVRQHGWDKNNKKMIKQSIQCLKCACGVVLNGGFLCAINPYLDLQQIPCQDWQERKD